MSELTLVNFIIIKGGNIVASRSDFYIDDESILEQVTKDCERCVAVYQADEVHAHKYTKEVGYELMYIARASALN